MINTKVDLFLDLSSWLKIYGYDVKNMLGSSYTHHMVYQPQAVVTSPQLAPDFGVMSGLQCIVDKVSNILRHTWTQFRLADPRRVGIR